MQTIYCISGLGADEGVFQYLDLSFVNPVFIQWIKPEKDETMKHYALRLKQHYIHEEDPVILGLSLGGMMATEIAKMFPNARVIIISSAKTKKEIPFYFKTFRYLPLYKTLPDWYMRQHSALRVFFLGTKNERSLNYIKHAAKHADGYFYRWAIGAILNWENETVPMNVIHVHGTNDNLLPYRYVQSDITVNNGGHLMIIDEAVEVSALIKGILENEDHTLKLAQLTAG